MKAGLNCSGKEREYVEFAQSISESESFENFCGTEIYIGMSAGKSSSLYTVPGFRSLYLLSHPILSRAKDSGLPKLS
jgi:hypothetical protein